jgi:hypothetical protein
MITPRSFVLSLITVLLCLPLLASGANIAIVGIVAIVINLALAYQVEKVWPSKKTPAPAEPERAKNERL